MIWPWIIAIACAVTCLSGWLGYWIGANKLCPNCKEHYSYLKRIQKESLDEAHAQVLRKAEEARQLVLDHAAEARATLERQTIAARDKREKEEQRKKGS